MAKRIITVFELLIAGMLLSMFAALVITTNTNDAIIEHTESFVELVRYKGVITDEMYDEFLAGFNTPVDINISVTKDVPFVSDTESISFSKDILTEIETSGSYKMDVGDEIEIIVRKPSGNYFDSIVGAVTGQYASSSNPVVAVKGGMILNTQYAE